MRGHLLFTLLSEFFHQPPLNFTKLGLKYNFSVDGYRYMNNFFDYLNKFLPICKQYTRDFTLFYFWFSTYTNPCTIITMCFRLYRAIQCSFSRRSHSDPQTLSIFQIIVFKFTYFCHHLDLKLSFCLRLVFINVIILYLIALVIFIIAFNNVFLKCSV